MSPHTRSLLALTALFSTIYAQSYCRDVILGRTTLHSLLLHDVSVPSLGGELYIPDNCPNQGYTSVVGERVRACNNNWGGYAPQAAAASPRQLQYVDVVCPDGCSSGVTVTVVQYCSIY